MEPKTGYVYVLINPSFKEDWVKVGKSARFPDIRSKELDNTAVPLPYEVYATLKTAKFNEAERLFHKNVGKLNSGLRIRKNREFFNIKPEDAADILQDIAGLLDDALVTYGGERKIAAVVCGERTVKFEGNEWTTSGLTKELFRRQNAVRNGGAYQGPLHFTFNGVRLTDLPEK